MVHKANLYLGGAANVGGDSAVDEVLEVRRADIHIRGSAVPALWKGGSA